MNLMRAEMIHLFVPNAFSEPVIYFQVQLLFKYLNIYYKYLLIIK